MREVDSIGRISESSSPTTSDSDFLQSEIPRKSINLSEQIDGSSQVTVANTDTQKIEQDNRSLNEKLDQELQKTRLGVGSDNALQSFLADLREKGKPRTGKEFKADGVVSKKFSELTICKMVNLNEEKSMTLCATTFAEKLKVIVEKKNEEDDVVAKNETVYNSVFGAIGKKFDFLLRKVPDYSYIRPCVAFNRTQLVKPKKERTKKEKSSQPANIVKGKTTKEVLQETGDKSSISKELDNVRRQLKEIWRCSGDKIGYYQLVIHPTNFGETIENMFYISFLVKDGLVRLEVDPENSVPSVVKICKNELKERERVDRSSWDTTQVLSKMTYKIWQELTHRLEIDKPMIIRRNNES